jgi:hypothetical protein
MPATTYATVTSSPSAGTTISSSSIGQQPQQQQQQQQQLHPSAAIDVNPTSNHPGGVSSLIYPSLHLYPLNDTFVPKQISLAPAGTRVKIGRQTNAKTVPNSTNGYFDSKVLSRMHAEVWSEDSKVMGENLDETKVLTGPRLSVGSQVFIKDVKSSNGTFINGERLSAESAESDVFELHNEDVVVRLKPVVVLGCSELML